jgi:hypothetical protein
MTPGEGSSGFPSDRGACSGPRYLHPRLGPIQVVGGIAPGIPQFGSISPVPVPQSSTARARPIFRGSGSRKRVPSADQEKGVQADQESRFHLAG